MKRVLRSAGALVFGFGVTIAAFGVTTTDQRDRRGTFLGKLDVPKYCETAYGPKAGAYAVTSDAYGWRCLTRPNDLATPREIVMDVACTKLYGKPSYAKTTDPTWLFSWYCYQA